MCEAQVFVTFCLSAVDQSTHFAEACASCAAFRQSSQHCWLILCPIVAWTPFVVLTFSTAFATVRKDLFRPLQSVLAIEHSIGVWVFLVYFLRAIDVQFVT